MNHRNRHRPATTVTYVTSVLAALAAIILLAALAGCGEKQEVVNGETKTQGLDLLLDWTPNPNHAGIYTGIEKQRFADRALLVKPQVSSDPAAIIQQVVSGRADLGISYQSEVLAARDKGAKVKAIASLVGTPLNSMAWLDKSKIKSTKDLAGKRVGYSGAYSDAYLSTILENNGVDAKKVKKTNLGYKSLENLQAGNVDAVIDVYWNVEGVQLEQEGSDATFTPVDKLGVPRFYELVFIASETALADGKRRDKIRSFLAGLQEGTADAVADPAFAQQALAGADKTLAKQKAFLKSSLAVTLPVLMPKDAGGQFGAIDPGVWDNYANWMRDNGLLDNPPGGSAAFDNSLLPPAQAN